MIKYFVTLLLFSFSSSALADSYACPGTFKTVQTGDSMQAVIAACGQPKSAIMTEEVAPKKVEAARWTYQLHDLAGDGGTDLTGQGGLVASLIVIFHDQRVVQVEKDELVGSLVGPAACKTGAVVKQSDTMAQVLSKCGNPDENIVRTMTVNVQRQVMVVTYVDKADYQAPVRLEFENNILTAIKR